jgi:hypothetical protein
MIDFYVHYDYHKIFSLKDIMKHYDGLNVLKYVSVREHVLKCGWKIHTNLKIFVVFIRWKMMDSICIRLVVQ